MRINWGVRLRNKHFWLTFIPAFLLLIQSIAATLGFHLILTDVSNRLTVVISSLFSVLTILGVVNDPTVEGLSDSKNAMIYDEPKQNIKS